MTAELTVRPLGADTWEAFADLAEHSDAFPSGCWCIGFHPEGVAKGDGWVATNRARKQARVFAGDAHAALVFSGDRCVGWCQFGPPDELPRIKNRREYEAALAPLPDWRIACCFTAKGHRRQGVAEAALVGALDLIARLGGGVVEGYPEPVEAVPAGFLYHGALSTYEQLGFTRDRLIGKHRWVVRTHIEPR
ncbi:MAG TPA: hypothetical protein VNQ73_17185 [Ilumatobacter sp.]|nr:hypothetical protein [Ilumatobacter sp.]